MAQKRRPLMPRSDRAKQFAPFSALKGLEYALSEKRMKLARRRIPDENVQQILNERISRLKAGDLAFVMHYTRGGYIKRTVRIYDVDTTKKAVVTDTGSIFFEDIYAIKAIDLPPAP